MIFALLSTSAVGLIGSCGPASFSTGVDAAAAGDAADASSDGASAEVPAAIAGTWYLTVDGARAELRVDPALTGTGTGAAGTGAITFSDGSDAPVDQLDFDPGGGLLEFHTASAAGHVWYRASVVEGVLAGRLTHPSASSAKPVATDGTQVATAYDAHVIGWQASAFDGPQSPRVWDLAIGVGVGSDGGEQARLRLDVDPAGGFSARLKVYSDGASGIWAEQPEYDAEVSQWDGATLSFLVHGPTLDSYSGVVDGRTLTGTALRGGQSVPFTGLRAEVLSHGYAPMTPDTRAKYQARARRQIGLLVVAGNPAPIARTVTELQSLAPLSGTNYSALRDDDPAHWPQDYSLRELQFDYQLPDPYGGPALTRRAHGYLSTPITTDGAVPARGFPAVLALNGHDGSAHALMDPENIDHWYGDGFARRGYVVLTLDVSHRPLADRGGLYDDYLVADDAAGGNELHPSIRSAAFDSDFTETGERAWDALAAFDYLVSQSNVDKARAMVTGMSMGGEVATYAAALDPRVQLLVSSNWSPDLSVLDGKPAHPCWRWVHGEIREFLDPSDLQALVAPRPLVVETGRVDYTFSLMAPPFAGDKQVLRRSRAAFTDAPDHVVHYLHPEEHHYHVGDLDPGDGSDTGVLVMDRVAPSVPFAYDWQTDDHTVSTGASLFDLIAGFLP